MKGFILFLFLTSFAFAQTEKVSMSDGEVNFWLSEYRHAVDMGAESEIANINKQIEPMMNSSMKNQGKRRSALYSAYSHFSNYMRFSNRMKACVGISRRSEVISLAALDFDFRNPPEPTVTFENENMCFMNDVTHKQVALSINEIQKIAMESEKNNPTICNEDLLKEIRKEALDTTIKSLAKIKQLETNLTATKDLYKYADVDTDFVKEIQKKFATNLESLGAQPPYTMPDGGKSFVRFQLKDENGETSLPPSEWEKWQKKIEDHAKITQVTTKNTVDQVKDAILQLNGKLSQVNMAMLDFDRDALYFMMRQKLQTIPEYLDYVKSYFEILDTPAGKLLYTSLFRDEKTGIGDLRGDTFTLPLQMHNNFDLSPGPCTSKDLACQAFTVKVKSSIDEAKATITKEYKELDAELAKGKFSEESLKKLAEYAPQSIANVFMKHPFYVSACSEKLCSIIKAIESGEKRKEKAKSIAFWGLTGVTALAAIAASGGAITPFVATAVSLGTGIAASGIEVSTAITRYHDYKKHEQAYFSDNEKTEGVVLSQESYDEFKGASYRAAFYLGMAFLDDGITLAKMCKDEALGAKIVTQLGEKTAATKQKELLQTLYDSVSPSTLVVAQRVFKNRDFIKKLMSLPEVSEFELKFFLGKLIRELGESKLTDLEVDRMLGEFTFRISKIGLKNLVQYVKANCIDSGTYTCVMSAFQRAKIAEQEHYEKKVSDIQEEKRQKVQTELENVFSRIDSKLLSTNARSEIERHKNWNEEVKSQFVFTKGDEKAHKIFYENLISAVKDKKIKILEMEISGETKSCSFMTTGQMKQLETFTKVSSGFKKTKRGNKLLLKIEYSTGITGTLLVSE